MRVAIDESLAGAARARARARPASRSARRVSPERADRVSPRRSRRAGRRCAAERARPAPDVLRQPRRRGLAGARDRRERAPAISPHAPSSLRRLSSRAGARVSSYEIVLPDGVTDMKLAAFAIKQAAVELRAGAPAARLAVGGIGRAHRRRSARCALRRGRGVLPRRGRHRGRRERDRRRRWRRSWRRLIRARRVARGLASRSSRATRSSRPSSIGSMGAIERDELRRRRRSRARGRRRRVPAIADLLSSELVRLEASPTPPVFVPASGRARSRSTTRSDSRPCWCTRAIRPPPQTRLDVTITLRSAARPTVRDPFTGQRLELLAFERDESTQRAHVRVPLRDRPLLVDFNDGLDATW